MERLTITLPADMADRIAERSGEVGAYDSKSEAVRELIRQGERLDEVERERDRLREQVMTQPLGSDGRAVLVEYVERERAIRERERERRRAPIWTRATWWVFGEPALEDS